MSFDAGAILGSVGLDLSDYASGILEAQAISGIFPQIVTEFLEEPLLAVVQTAKEAAASLVEMILDVSEAQHQVAQSAEALGVSVEFLDGWRKAAEHVGVQADEVGQALTFMQRSAFAAAKDGADPAAQAYAKLGISVADALGHIKPTEQLAREVADALNHMAGGVERTGLAMEIFGRGGASAISFFSKGSQAIDGYTRQLAEMGDLTTEQSAKSAAAFEGMLADVSHAWEGIKVQLAEPLRETLTPILQEALDWVHQHPADIQNAVGNIAHAITSAFSAVKEVIMDVTEVTKVFLTTFVQTTAEIVSHADTIAKMAIGVAGSLTQIGTAFAVPAVSLASQLASPPPAGQTAPTGEQQHWFNVSPGFGQLMGGAIQSLFGRPTGDLMHDPNYGHDVSYDRDHANGELKVNVNSSVKVYGAYDTKHIADAVADEVRKQVHSDLQSQQDLDRSSRQVRGGVH